MFLRKQGLHQRRAKAPGQNKGDQRAETDPDIIAPESTGGSEQYNAHDAAQESRMAELREWMAKLEVNQQYSDEQVRMAVERITVVDAETIRIRFRYPGAELEKKL